MDPETIYAAKATETRAWDEVKRIERAIFEFARERMDGESIEHNPGAMLRAGLLVDSLREAIKAANLASDATMVLLAETEA